MQNRIYKVAMHNLGCKVNSYEADAMVEKLKNNGFEIVPFEEGADIYIINTCTVTNMADRKSRQMLHRAKKMNRDAIVIAVGCYVQAAGEDLLKDEAVDIIVGNNKKNEIVDIIRNYMEDRDEEANKAYIVSLDKNCEYEDMRLSTSMEHTRAFIKIQDGCNQFCTYCIIPYSRGRIRSRDIEDIEAEIRELARNGYKEIVLNGIHLSSYGRDIKDSDIGLIDVIERLGKIEGVERIRLGSLEQGIITKEFMDRVSGIKVFCPHFHLSLQSGCRDTLKRMNRHYTPEEYLEKCRLIRKYYPKAAITTDVIVGFPMESDAEFEETKKFIEEVNFSEMHIFKYSKRQGTVAAGMEGQVAEPIKAKRSDELILLGNKLRKQYLQEYLGQDVDILFEETHLVEGEKYWVGYTKEYVKVAVSEKDALDKDISGQIISVKIKSILNDEILLAQFNEIY